MPALSRRTVSVLMGTIAQALHALNSHNTALVCSQFDSFRTEQENKKSLVLELLRK